MDGYKSLQGTNVKSQLLFTIIPQYGRCKGDGVCPILYFKIYGTSYVFAPPPSTFTTTFLLIGNLSICLSHI